jgi:dinuclear metal center YbgI/SA1388 family protein
MILRGELVSYLDELLECANFQDHAPNGLQIEGKNIINKICTAVTAAEETIDQAIVLKADALLVHHGYFWRGEDASITGIKRQRVAKLLNHEISLFAYHLPLDCHPDLGNNALLGKLLNPSSIRIHCVGKTPNLLWTGKFKKIKSSEQFAIELKKKFGRKPQYVSGGAHLIAQVAWCSGAAQDFIEKAYELGADAYISGEISERTYYQAKELGIHYYGCGHHATERHGIYALGSHLASKFQLQHQFIDSANPV